MEAASFLHITLAVEIMCNALTALAAPQQYDIGLSAVQQIKEGQHLHRLHPNLGHWNSVWSGFSIIVNRMTPFHQDAGGAPSDYDLLISSGTHTNCHMEILDLGLCSWHRCTYHW